VKKQGILLQPTFQANSAFYEARYFSDEEIILKLFCTLCRMGTLLRTTGVPGHQYVGIPLRKAVI